MEKQWQNRTLSAVWRYIVLKNQLYEAIQAIIRQ